MGQLSVILVIGALFLGGIFALNAQRFSSEADEETTAYHGDRLAREAAVVGLEQTERALADSLDGWALWTTNPAAVRAWYGSSGTHGDATYMVTIDSMTIETPPPPGSPPTFVADKVWVTSTSTLDVWNPDTDSREETDFVIRATYEKGWTDVGTPPAWQRAVVANNLCLQGNTRINGDIHANGELCGNPSSSYVVNGDGTYTGNLGSRTRTENFDDVYYRDLIPVPAVVLPPISERDCQLPGPIVFDNQNVDVPDGWLCGVSGQGTAANPFVLVINGNLEVRNFVNLKGHVKIYVTGTTTFHMQAKVFSPLDASINTSLPNGNSDLSILQTWAAQNLVDGSGTFVGTTLGIYSQDDIIMQGTPKVIAHLYTNGTVQYGGSGQGFLIGGILARGNLLLNGSPPIVYTEANQSLIDGGTTYVPEGVRLIAYREWADRP